VWALGAAGTTTTPPWVVLSFLASTRVLSVGEGEMADVSDPRLARLNEPTLACGALARAGGGALLVQATAAGVFVGDPTAPTGAGPAPWWTPRPGAALVRAHMASDGSGCMVLSHARPATVTVATATASLSG
jgi:hypothetical protein